jgi:Flp pilus assembly protein TadG
MNTKPRIKAQSLVEFALIIALVVFMFTVFVDVCRVLYYYTALNNSVREGARYAVVHSMETGQDIDDIKNVVKHYAVGLNQDDINVVVTPPGGGDTVTVSASYQFIPVTPGLQLIIGAGGMTLQTQSSMLVSAGS